MRIWPLKRVMYIARVCESDDSVTIQNAYFLSYATDVSVFLEGSLSLRLLFSYYLFDRPSVELSKPEPDS